MSKPKKSAQKKTPTPKKHVPEFTEEEAESAIVSAEYGIDDTWETLAGFCGKDLQAERDAVRDALDAMVAAAGIDR